MFPLRYFGGYFAPRYWPEVGATPVSVYRIYRIRAGANGLVLAPAPSSGAANLLGPAPGAGTANVLAPSPGAGAANVLGPAPNTGAPHLYKR